MYLRPRESQDSFHRPSSIFWSTSAVFLFNLMMRKLKRFVFFNKTSVCCEKVLTLACSHILKKALVTKLHWKQLPPSRDRQLRLEQHGICRQRGKTLQCCSVSYAVSHKPIFKFFLALHCGLLPSFDNKQQADW